ncbi:MAG TPA: DUF885 domain-containing protein, partial [Beutenbergiaceae bacterium]|nr:DUF885 domain-containing protein [Beutenbergiaceae bacterium]
GAAQRDLNNLASPSQDIRMSFDMLPKHSEEDWQVIAARLANVPHAMEGYIATLRQGIETGNAPAARQVEIVTATLDDYLDEHGYFHRLIHPATNLSPGLRADLERGAQRATRAYAEFAAFLTGELYGRATSRDAVGREFYELHSRRFLGASIDLDETYQWGVEELQRMRQEQLDVANQILPGATVAEAIAHLDADPARTLHGTQALQEWMQRTSDAAIEALGTTHFDIAPALTNLQCMIAPTTSGEIYYTPPTDDFSRPGQMWWSVPRGVETFTTWREKTTVYHEGVPGHHLQLGQAIYNRDLNLWRRSAGTSGHAEGWALYAERLMQELGFMDDPGDLLGLLDGQRMRAARVVLDIGVHLEKPTPPHALPEAHAGVWDYEFALAFMHNNVAMDRAFIEFEVNRYFGWPGQAPSYKIGQRIFDQLRAHAQSQPGFDFTTYHMQILNLGGLGLDTLQQALTRADQTNQRPR